MSCGEDQWTPFEKKKGESRRVPEVHRVSKWEQKLVHPRENQIEPKEKKRADALLAPLWKLKADALLAALEAKSRRPSRRFGS